MKPSITLRLLVVAVMLLLITISVTFAQTSKPETKFLYEVKAGTFANGEFTPITVSDTLNSTKGSFKKALRDAVKTGKAGFSYKNQWYISGILVEKSTRTNTKSQLIEIKVSADSTSIDYYFKTAIGGLVIKYVLPASKIDFYVNKKILPSHSPTSAQVLKNIYTTNLLGEKVIVKTTKTNISFDEVRSLIKN